MDKADLPDAPEVFHSGERQLQTRYGSRELLARNGARIVQPFLTEQLQTFFQALPYVCMASQDAMGRLWPTLLCHQPGFIQIPEPNQLIIRIHTDNHDPFTQGLTVGNHIGMLGIDLSNRRRNRVNGRITHRTTDAIHLKVDQAFGNCPKYIQQRSLTSAVPATPATPIVSQYFNSLQAGIIQRADTCFITSCHLPDAGDKDVAAITQGIDISHRGGNPGFIEILDEQTLLLPDYPGNRFFNTLGNLLHQPVAGLLLLDFTHGHSLQLTGSCELDFGPPRENWPAGAERLIRFSLHKAVLRAQVLPLRGAVQAYSPYLAFA